MYRHTRYHIHKNLYLDCLCVCSYRESAKGKYKIHKYRNKRIKSRTSSAYYEQYFQILSAYTHTSVRQCVWNIDANRSHILESVRPLTQKTKFPHTDTQSHTQSATLIGTCSTLVECIFCAWQRALRYALSPPCYAWSRRQFCKSSNPMQLPFWTRARGCFNRKIVSRKYVKLIIFVLTLIRV